MCRPAAYSVSVAESRILSTLLHHRLQLVWSLWSSKSTSCCRTTIGNQLRRADKVVYMQLPSEMLSVLSRPSCTPVWWRQHKWKTTESGFSGCWMEPKQCAARQLSRFGISYMRFVFIDIRSLCHCTIISCVYERNDKSRCKSPKLIHLTHMFVCCSKHNIKSWTLWSADGTSVNTVWPFGLWKGFDEQQDNTRFGWISAKVSHWSFDSISSAGGVRLWFCRHDCHNRLWGDVRVQTWRLSALFTVVYTERTHAAVCWSHDIGAAASGISSVAGWWHCLTDCTNTDCQPKV